ncbi:tagaturonate reductase [Ammoniphilus resinae]|nr:tagaturonate reductase [Ammoniphilus resinae]
MNRLSKELFPDIIEEALPDRIIQFGEGNFLRGFIDWMVHQLNKQGLFNGRIVAVQPTPHGKVVPKLNAQDGLYTLILRGLENGRIVEKVEIISSVSRGIDPYKDWPKVLEVACNPEIDFVFSNTTEAGLVYLKETFEPQKCPISFPGKLTAFLYHRFQTFEGSPDAGLTILPCELVEGNGHLLRKLVLRHSEEWGLELRFLEWVEKHVQFCNTLVDRIITGYPAEEMDYLRIKLGYDDELLTVGEPYHLFAIEAPPETADALPFLQIGLNVHWGDIRPFHHLKVRILNGAHTMFFSAALLAGKNTVVEAMQDDILRSYLLQGIYREVLPCLEVGMDQKKAFADSVMERLSNPFNQHRLLDIALHSVSKFKVRLLPTLLETVSVQHKLPAAVAFSLASLIAYYQNVHLDENGSIVFERERESYVLRDDLITVNFLKQAWLCYDGSDRSLQDLISYIFAQHTFWGLDLNTIPDLSQIVFKYLKGILRDGVIKALQRELLS